MSVCRILKLHDRVDARIYLAEFDPRTRRRGEQCYLDGAVRKIECQEEGREFTAKVQGSVLYHTSISYDEENGSWMSDCNCPLAEDCQHVYALLKSLLEGPRGADTPPPPRGAPPKPRRGTRAGATLEDRLESALKRELSSKELTHLQTLRRVFTECSVAGSITVGDIRQLTPGFGGQLWDRVQLWPRFPADDHRFWLHIAWELRKRQLSIPAFMEPITDLALIEPTMVAWERSRQTEHWQRRLEQVDGFSNRTALTRVEFRMVLQQEATLQWRPEGAEEFQSLKAAQFKQLGESFIAGQLEMRPELFPLWHAFFIPWDLHRVPRLDPKLNATCSVLRQILRQPALHDLVVGASGVPLIREARPLRWELTAPETGEGDYRVELLQADGVPLPSCLFVLPGSPPFYLTTDTVFEGPPNTSNVLEVTRPNLIPASALETRPGVNLLERLSLPVPERLKKKIRKVPLRVCFEGRLKPTYDGSKSESLFLTVAAEDGAELKEIYGPQGWFVSRKSGNAKTKAAKPGREIVVHQRTDLEGVPAAVNGLGLRWDPYNLTWSLRVTRNFPEQFSAWLAGVSPKWEMKLDPVLASLAADPIQAKVQLDCQEAGVDWFDLQVTVDVGTTELTQEEIKALLNARGGLVRLGEKGWRRINYDISEEEDERLARLGLSPHEFSAEPQRLHALQLADEAASGLLPEEQMNHIRRRAGEIKARVTPAVPKDLQATLRPYQVEGFHFLSYLATNRFGGVLADDMGLGKTVQTLAWLSWLRAGEKDSPKPILVVSPKSVMDTWRGETERFLPGLRVRVWDGACGEGVSEAIRSVDLFVVNYAQLRLLEADLVRTQWLAAILDEGQFIKNPNSQTALAARKLKADHRLVLSGTPIENRLLDLWSLMHFAMPGVLGNKTAFSRRFDQKTDPLARRRLSARVRPFLLRRTKNQVARELPDRIEEDIFCELEPEQKTLYQAEFKHAQRMLLKIKSNQELDKNRFHFLTSLLRLRQICCHPALVSEECAKAGSAKLEALLEILGPLMEEGHKVLVFSQFVSMLEILRAAIKKRSYNYFYLTGATEDRGPLVKSFQEAEGGAIFLVSLKAGGFGLNLTAASYVVLFDPWWNPAVENQAIDRTHRIGQTRNVIAYRLLIKNSIEEKIRKLQQEKSAIAEDVLGEERFSQSLTLDDLHYLFSEE